MLRDLRYLIFTDVEHFEASGDVSPGRTLSEAKDRIIAGLNAVGALPAKDNGAQPEPDDYVMGILPGPASRDVPVGQVRLQQGDVLLFFAVGDVEEPPATVRMH